MRILFPLQSSRGQTALEYLLLLAVVAAVVFFGFRNFVPQVRENSEAYYNQISNVLRGENPRPIDGGWCPAYCPKKESCGPAMVSKVCACPSPAFGGDYCEGTPFVNCPRDSSCKAECKSDTTRVCLVEPYLCGDAHRGFDQCGDPCVLPACADTCAGNGTCATCLPKCVNTCSPPEVGGILCSPATDDYPIPAGTTWKVVATQDDCNNAKCTKYCGNDLELNVGGTNCVPPYCKGVKPQNATLCPGSIDPPLSSASSYKVVASCQETTITCGPGSTATTCVSTGAGSAAGGECEYSCDAFHHISGNATCAPNTCSSPAPANACPNAAVNVPTEGNGWSPVRDCSRAAACSHLRCNPGETIVNNRCQ